MKTLVVGVGVVGCAYGWVLSEAGVEITHVVRPGEVEKRSAPVMLDVLDEREGYPRTRRVGYVPRVVDAVSPGGGFELVIVATKHYQAADAVREYRECLPDATFLLFTANWDGLAAIDAVLPRSRYLWGYSVASGGRRGDQLLINMAASVRLGELDGVQTPRLQAIVELFARAGIRGEVQANIIEWLWVHHAINAGTIGTALYAGGIREATEDLGLMRRGMLATREALAVVRARGVNLARYRDARSILRVPSLVGALCYRRRLTKTEMGRRVMSAGHFYNDPTEMKRFYLDVVQTGTQLGVAMPHLLEMRERIVSYRPQPPADFGCDEPGQVEVLCGPWLWLFPASYAIHIAEEALAGERFYRWIGRVAGREIGPGVFLGGNLVYETAMIMAVRRALAREDAAWIVPMLWTITAINGLGHVAGSVATRSYSPGLVSGAGVWAPLGAISVARGRRVLPRALWRRGVAAGALTYAGVALLAWPLSHEP
jgi:ketopantoate reductase